MNSAIAYPLCFYLLSLSLSYIYNTLREQLKVLVDTEWVLSLSEIKLVVLYMELLTPPTQIILLLVTELRDTVIFNMT